MHEKKDVSGTYLLLETDNSGTELKMHGYFTMGIKCLAMDGQHNLSKNMFSKMNIRDGVAQSYLLGQLAKTDGSEKGLGRDMIERAMCFFSKGNEMFGCRVVRLDCKNPLVRYYEPCGFVLSGKNRDGTLDQMVAVI